MPKDSLARVVQHYLGCQLQALLNNEEGVLEGRDPECLHRFRVALRRTRSVLAEMKAYLTGEVLEFRSALAAIAQATNDRRDADVFVANLLACRHRLPDFLEPGLDPIIEIVEARRQRAQAQVVSALKGEQYQRIKSRWQQLVSENPGDWAADVELNQIVAQKLSKRLRKFLKDARRLSPASDPKEIHRLRIQGKKVRYLLEFAVRESVNQRSRKILGSLEKLQTALGAYHDASVEINKLRELLEADEDLAKQPAAVTGYLIRLLEQKQDKAWRKIFKQLSRLAAKRPTLKHF